MAGKQNNKGIFLLNDKIAYTDEMLATIFRRPLNTVRLALKTFENYGMIEIVNNVITIPKWDEHQSLDMLEKIREKNRLKIAAYRNKQKNLIGKECNGYSNGYSNGYVTGIDRDIEEDKDIDRDKEIKKENIKEKKCNHFTPPSLEEVQAYCEERNNNVDAQRFIDYYTANGWKVGRNPMKDWKATVRTWERQDYERKPTKSNNQHSVLDDMQELYNKYKAEEENENI